MGPEAKLERACVSLARKAGGLLEKFVSPSNRGVPDRILFMHGGQLVLVEFKAPGKRPTALQDFKHQQYRKLGFRVEVVDNIDRFKEILEELK